MFSTFFFVSFSLFAAQSCQRERKKREIEIEKGRERESGIEIEKHRERESKKVLKQAQDFSLGLWPVPKPVPILASALTS